jgi:glutamate/aspartate transport system substrate-binding protein
MHQPAVRIVLLLAALASTAASSAQESTGVLKRVKDAGEITLGYRESSVPFSYLDDRQQPIGYSVDLCLRVVDAVKTELKLPRLRGK